MKPDEALGIDYADTIAARNNGITIEDDPNFLERKFFPDVNEVLARLVAERFGEKVYVISQVDTEEAKKRITQYLDYHNFWAHTGISRERLYFCWKRKEKAPICDSLGITHFVDDYLEVLSYMKSVPHKFAFRPRAEEKEKFKDFLPHIQVVESWDEIAGLLL